MIDLVPEKRGLYRVASAHLASLFPLGFFRKGNRQTIDREFVVFPRLLPRDGAAIESSAALGSRSSRRTGWGHELHSLRSFRAGDDPRRIHWKQSARTGRMIFMEREAEENKHISIVLDNALAPGEGEIGEQRLERRISQAASTALDYLKLSYEVELVTRTIRVPFGSGVRQRRRLLEALALLEPAAPSARPLLDEGEAQVRFDA